MDRLILEELINSQRESFLKKSCGFKRHVTLDKHFKHDRIVVISGIRRCGKSTLLRQLANYLHEDFHYLNFDDERMTPFKVTDFDQALTILLKSRDSNNILLDEIQNIEGWERFVRRIHDEGFKIFLTGSNAYLLSSELGTHLTGRYVKIELYPFSFKERVEQLKLSTDNISSSKKVHILKCFDEYLSNGGFPEYLNYNEPEFLTRIYEDILYRDIITRHGIKEVKSFLNLAHYLFSNFTGDISYNKLKQVLGFKSATSIGNYVSFMERAYLIFEVFKYDYSLKKQHLNSKKVYVIDNGMKSMVAFQFSRDMGKHLENLLAVEFLRQGYHLHFYREQNECDFVVSNKAGELLYCIQVCYDLNDSNYEREVAGVDEAMTRLNVSEGYILTYDQADTVKTPNNNNIQILPAWRWLLDLR